MRKALQTDEYFRERVAAADIIVISTGPNDFGRIGKAIENGTCGGADDTACVVELDRRWHRDFDAILSEIEELWTGQPTAIRLVSVPNELSDPSSSSPATHRGWEAAFEALAQAMCDNAEKHDVVCIDTRPLLNGPDFEQPPDVERRSRWTRSLNCSRRPGFPNSKKNEKPVRRGKVPFPGAHIPGGD